MRVIFSVALLLGLAGGAAAQSPGDTVRLTLEDAVRRAVERGEEMRAARADQRDAQGRVTEATAAALPHVTGDVVYTRLFNTIFEDAAADSSFGPIFANTPFGAPNQWSLELRATQLLFAGGKVGAALKGARAYRRAAAEQTAETEANVIYAVKRAYLELEREGVILTQQGKGSRVATNPGLGMRLHEEELKKHLEQAIRLSAVLGLRPEELESRLRKASDNAAPKEVK